MIKSELVSAIAEKANLTKAAAAAAVNTYHEVIAEELAKGGTVDIAGFGKYFIGERSERTGRNPQTGETIKIAASKCPKFKAGKQFKDAVK